MIIVSNTSPLTNLAAIEQFELLKQLYGELHIASAVWDELNRDGIRWPGSDEVEQANWIQHHQVKNRELVIALQRDLDQGEAESIVLALEIKADLLLLDEKEGRHAAQRLGLRVIGVVGVLLEAKAKNLIDVVGPSLNELRQKAGFYLSNNFYQSVLKLAGES
jgi:predicted nucleic acid-binding protein